MKRSTLMNIMNNVTIHHSAVYNFLTSMYRLNCSESFTKRFDELEIQDKVKINPEICEWIDENKARIIPSIQEKMDIFINKETFYGLCLVNIVACSGISDVHGFIDYIKKLPYEELLMEFLDTGYGTGEVVDSELIENLLNDKKEAKEAERKAKKK
jgi:hypothetical protein